MKREIFKIEKNKNKKYKKYSIIERSTRDCILNSEFQNLIREIGEKRISQVFLNFPLKEKIILQNFNCINSNNNSKQILDGQRGQYLSIDGKTSPDDLFDATKSRTAFETINKIAQGESVYDNSKSHVLVIPSFLNDRCANLKENTTNYSINNLKNEEYFYVNSTITNNNKNNKSGNTSDFDEDLYFSFD